MTKQWKVTGTKGSNSYTVYVEAKNHNTAVMIGSKKHMLVVHSCALMDLPHQAIEWSPATARQRVGGTFGS